jgi:acyl-CoA thioesterase-1
MIVVVFALTACDRAPKAAPPAAPAAAAPASAGNAAPRPVILFIGTSLTAGYGLEPDQSYPAVIARRLDSLHENYEVVDAGVSGETSADARGRIGWLLRRPAAVILLETGANDGLRGLSVDSMRANIQAIIDSIRTQEPHARIILMAMEALPNMGPRYAADFHRAFPELAKKNGVTYLPFLLTGVAGIDTLNQADGIHPNIRGAQIVATNVMRILLPVLDSLNGKR